MGFKCLILVRIGFIWLAFRKATASFEICDFETDEDALCGYTQDADDDFDWSLRQGGTPTSNTGPAYDHTLGVNSTGHYMYIEASGPGNWDIARLSSPISGPSPGFCLRFYYHMHGEDTGRLSVRLRSDGALASEALWTRKGSQGDEWMEAAVDGSSPSEFQVVFEAKRGEGFKSDIAIDDVSLALGFTCGGTVIVTPSTSEPVTSDDEPIASPSTKTLEPINGQQPSVTKQQGIEVSNQPARGVTSSPLEPIDSQLIIVVLVAGLSFWGVVLAVLAAVIYKTRQSRRCKKGNVTYDVVDDPTSQEEIVMATEGTHEQSNA
ncbi:MAM domain-containing protein 2-like [Patiria miniata]|uniref:MAM domain-containing protein n=1 Tax=Patiria miniata TaxID=46514 RepID=A0A914BNE0_PATMI|nr:MAM domain-containing protein 2-like [Patiria miniata]